MAPSLQIMRVSKKITLISKKRLPAPLSQSACYFELTKIHQQEKEKMIHNKSMITFPNVVQ